MESDNPVLVPRREVLYGGVVGRFAWHRCENGAKISIMARGVLNAKASAVVSRSHSIMQTDEWFAKEAVTETVRAGFSLKFSGYAERSADVYPSLRRTMEWDTTAGYAVL